MMSFAAEYNEEMDEDAMQTLISLTIVVSRRWKKTPVIDPACLDMESSNILNHMYPRVFQGNYKSWYLGIVLFV